MKEKFRFEVTVDGEELRKILESAVRLLPEANPDAIPEFGHASDARVRLMAARALVLQCEQETGKAFEALRLRIGREWKAKEIPRETQEILWTW